MEQIFFFFLIFQKVIITDIIDQLFAYPSLEELCGRFCIILEKEISKAGNHTLYGMCMHEAMNKYESKPQMGMCI